MGMGDRETEGGGLTSVEVLPEEAGEVVATVVAASSSESYIMFVSWVAMYCVSILSRCSALAPVIVPSELSLVLRMEAMIVVISSGGVVTAGVGLPCSEQPERTPASAVSASVSVGGSV